MPATTPRPPSSEQVAAFDRNAWSGSIGISGRNPRNPQSNVSVVTLVPFITRQKMLGIFPLKLATDAIGDNGWQTTAMAAAQLAKTKWVRMQADMALSGYRIFSAEGQLSEPEWPDTPFNELLDIAFKDYVIASEDHPVLNRIMGRI